MGFKIICHQLDILIYLSILFKQFRGNLFFIYVSIINKFNII